MRADLLHVFTTRSNPLNWQRPHENYRRFADHVLSSGAQLTVIECAYGAQDFVCELPGVNHVGVRATTRGWCKENLLNLGVWRTPAAEYLAWVDADVIFRRPDWAAETVRALQHYAVVQPWQHCYDLGPNGEHVACHTSFAHQFFWRKPLVPDDRGKPYWQAQGGSHVYPHSGFCFAWTRRAYEAVGGWFELGGMGSGDHHMALGLAGLAEHSLAPGSSAAYNEEVLRWQRRALFHVNRNVGYLGGTIEHLYHGRKVDRNYIGRWDMFLRYGFDPHEDLKRNAHGVYEFATNKPELRNEFDRYLHQRNEDANTLS